MGFLDLFKKKQDIKDLIIGELKQDKERLLKEVEELKKILYSNLTSLTHKTNKPKETKEPKPLSPYENNLIKLYNENKPITKKDFIKLSKLKEISAVVILSRMKKKGVIFEFKPSNKEYT